MIAIVDYDASWPTKFAAEASAIQEAFGSLALRIEHVGSTAVPGLAAKPVIDIQISVASLLLPSPYYEALQRLGYRHVALGNFDAVYPFFQKPPVWPTTHHVHLCVVGSEEEDRHLAFRDYLRNNRAVARDYVGLKQSLAAENHGATLGSREKYSLSKTEFVWSVLARARSNRS